MRGGNDHGNQSPWGHAIAEREDVVDDTWRKGRLFWILCSETDQKRKNASSIQMKAIQSRASATM